MAALIGDRILRVSSRLEVKMGACLTEHTELLSTLTEYVLWSMNPMPEEEKKVGRVGSDPSRRVQMQRVMV